jgi:glutamate-ammonia-ligase adenylyltransferase
MANPALKQTIETSPDPERAARFLTQLRQTSAAAALETASADRLQPLTSVLAGSQYLSELLVRYPDWVPMLLDPESLRYPRKTQGLQRELSHLLDEPLAGQDQVAAWRALREFKQRQTLRIAARDLARLGHGAEITQELSDLADACLQAACRMVEDQWGRRLGRPWHCDPGGRWHPTPFCVLGMGKLGGQELNYSSDVDLLFVYGDEGQVLLTPPKGREGQGKGLTNHQFFTRVAESLIAELTRLAPEGSLYRIDLRLRPEGPSGPLVRSLSSYENYYAQWGQTWERMMLLKARCTAGDPALAAEFLDTVQPFRYPRSLSERILREVAGMKARIETEVLKSDELERNVKLGRGGIREIEFVVQTLQLLHAGRQPFLQEWRTLPALDKLAQYRLLDPEEAPRLRDAYLFLRDVEHRLQMENGLQTHSLPRDARARGRLARLMGCRHLAEFEARLRDHTSRVRRVYESLLKSSASSTSSALPLDLEADAPAWKRLLAEHAFRDPNQALHLIRHFVLGPGYVHVSPRTTELARDLITQLLGLCPSRNEDGPWTMPNPALSDPDRVLARMDSFIAAYGSRALLYETWTSNPSLFRLLLMLFDRSEFLAEMAIRTPDLVDDLELSGRLRRAKTAEETLHDLHYGLADADQQLWLRRYHQAEFMRIGLRDILGLSDFEQNLAELTALAEACLRYACEVVCRRHRLRSSPFAILGLGKLGGRELIYGSDLDVIFVSARPGKNTERLQALAVEVRELLSAPTELGVAYKIDTRLRPDGEKGLLVNSLKAHEDYYRQRGQLWEIQALTRARAVAGDPATGRAFENLAAQLTNFARPDPSLMAYTPDWKSQIIRMRERIEKERTPAGKGQLAFKTGSGGLVDAEFIAQMFALEHGWQESNTLRALLRAREAKVLPEPDATPLIDNYRQLRRIEGILRRWSFEGENLFPDDPAPQYRVAVRCGFASAAAFLQAVDDCRKGIREVYLRIASAAGP